MKTPIFSLISTSLATFGLLLSVSASGFAATDVCDPESWNDFRVMAETCLEDRAAGKECESVNFISDRAFQFNQTGQEYAVEMIESQFADPYSKSSDLNDVLIVRSEDQCTWELRNVPYGDVLEALASVKTR